MAGGGGGRGGEAVVMGLEDAVKLLVEHLVQPVLPRGALRREAALAPEKQETVARQVHATALLYNYYHRKQHPQLDFADPKRFTVSASLAAGEPLLVYLNQGGGDAESGVSVTDKAVVDACGIAQALDATVDSPDMTSWPISKVAVLLVDPTRKKCLIEHGSVTKGVWSILEKDITTPSGKSMPGSSDEALPSEPYMLQQMAYSMAETRTGIKRTSLRYLDEHLVYSLSQKETTAKLFVLQYDQTVNSNLKETPIEDLISRMSGPIFRSEPCPETTSVVECYHILPYKEVLVNLLNRKRSLESSQSVPKDKPLRKGKSSLHSEIDETSKGQDANSKPNIKKAATNAKKNKLVKEEHPDEESPRKENGSFSIPNMETSKFLRNSANAEATRATSNGGLVNVETSAQMDKNRSNGGFDNLQTSVEMDNNKTQKRSISENMAVAIIKVNAPEVDPTVTNHAYESQTEKVTQLAGGTTVNANAEMYALLQSIQKMRDATLREHCMLGDRSAEFDMDIQTILTEGNVTPKVASIIKKYEENSRNVTKVDNSTQTMKRKRLTEAVLRNKCQELDEICRENNWTLPRYTVLPSLIDGLYRANVYLTCPDLEMCADGDTKTTPRDARESAATNMLDQLHMKAREKLAEQGMNTPAAVLHDKTPDK